MACPCFYARFEPPKRLPAHRDLIDEAVAVIVDAIALFRALRVHELIVVVAIAITHGDAIAVLIEALIDQAIVVIVDAIANLGLDARAAVLIDEVVAVVVDHVPADLRGRHATARIIDEAVAVIITAIVANLLGRARIASLVDATITVVVLTIAGLSRWRA